MKAQQRSETQKASQVSDFNHTIAHTVEEWRDYFFTVNPDVEDIESLDFLDQCVKNNLHSLAFMTYLKRKFAKGLISGLSDFACRFLKEQWTT